MKVLAIIPARRGSKGLPGKNIAVIDGKPLIQYSIEAALDSKRIAAVCVSSDDPQVHTVARSFTGVKVHERDPSIAGDTSPVTETIDAVLRAYPEEFDAVMILQPTAPIRSGEQIDEAIGFLAANRSANSLISVCAMNDVHPARMYWKTHVELEPILQAFEQVRRQDIPPAFYRNGSIYMVRTSIFRQTGSVMSKPSIGFVMPYSQLLNIDEPRDLLIAEPLIKAWKRGEL